MNKKIKGNHVLIIFVLGFGITICVNLILAFNAIRTFPGLEVRNSYVASQSFQADRAAQTALGWEVSAHLAKDVLVLRILQDGHPVNPQIEQAILGRATSMEQDQELEFIYEDGVLHASVVAAERGNWNLRLKALAADGTAFAQRVIVEQGV